MAEKNWWDKAVAYQVYPKSFADSNGDGIGDIPGVIGKLDYLSDLGIDVIWLSPMYPSPLADQGYDIADYYGIDPRFGTLDDMTRLIKEAEKRDIKIILDLVVNHCSDEHEWFQKALKDPDGKYGKYFYLEDIREDGKLPTNWRSYFGGTCWEPLGDTGKQYLHVFHKKQPDLNWENPEVREEVYKNINWWLDRGIAGFRVDAIINIKKHLPLQSYPADGEDGLSDIGEMLKLATGVDKFLSEMRDRAFKPHHAFTVGEVSIVEPKEFPKWIGNNGYFSTIFDFSTAFCGKSEHGWYACKDPLDAEDYKQCVIKAQKAVAEYGLLSNIIENHDEPRGVSHYLSKGEANDYSKKMLGGLNFMLRGIPFIYQGQEIGMENTVFTSISDVDDCGTFVEYQRCLDRGMTKREALDVIARFCRDNARTPMQWSAEENAGFTTGNPWLKPNPNYKTINVETQSKNDNSVLAFYKKLINLRRSVEYSDTVVYGEFIPYLPEQKNLFAYYRKGEKTLLVVGNFQSKRQNVIVPEGKILINNYDRYGDCLEPYQFLILEINV
jgi:oligo-1,6-glucosidase